MASSVPYSTTDDDFIIYPNPNSGQFQIKKPQSMQITLLRIYDIFGHLAYQSKTGDTDLNLSGIHAGVYFVEVQTGNKTYKAKKMIIE